MIVLDVLAALVIAATLAALVAEQVALGRARRRALAQVQTGHDYTLLPGGWPLHHSTCRCRPALPPMSVAHPPADFED